MCLAVPGKIVKLSGQEAEVDFGGVLRKASVQFTPQAKVGSYVLVHAGFAIQEVAPDDAARMLEVFREIYGKEF